MKERHTHAHMRAALVYANLSYCDNRKVGSVIVKNNSIIAIGYNGTPPNTCNCCEDEFGNTLPEVIHAEHNAIKKLEHDPSSLEGSIVFVTYGPCINCIQLMQQYKIKSVYYGTHPTKQEEIHFLEESGMEMNFLSIEKLI
ncbi:MAG: deaminase [Nitrososphaeraceae archaeon]